MTQIDDLPPEAQKIIAQSEAESLREDGFSSEQLQGHLQEAYRHTEVSEDDLELILDSIEKNEDLVEIARKLGIDAVAWDDVKNAVSRSESEIIEGQESIRGKPEVDSGSKSDLLQISALIAQNIVNKSAGNGLTPTQKEAFFITVFIILIAKATDPSVAVLEIFKSRETFQKALADAQTQLDGLFN